MAEELFNNHNISPQLQAKFLSFIALYPGKVSGRKGIQTYIEEYKNDKGQNRARLRDKETNKEIVFWICPMDSEGAEQKKGLAEFVAYTKFLNDPDFFDRKGHGSIYVEGLFGRETENSIEVISYMSKLYYCNSGVMAL